MTLKIRHPSITASL